MKRALMVVLLVNLLLSACAPVTAPALTPVPSATPLSVAILAPTNTATPTDTPTPLPTPTDTATPSPTPSPTATATPTPISTLPPEQVGGLTGVPDPRVTNPELFSLTRSDAPIPQFVNAMKNAGIEVLPEEVLKNLQFISTKADGTPLLDQDGKPFIVATYNLDPDPNQTGETLEGPIPLFIATQNENGEWGWGIFNFRTIQRICGITTAIYIEPGNQLANYSQIIRRFPSLVIPNFWHVSFSRGARMPNFGLMNDYLDKARNERLGVVFTPPVWQNPYFLPEWFRNNPNREDFFNMLNITFRFMQQNNPEVVSVINEPYSGDFYEKIGIDYVEVMREARNQFSSGKLMINNFDVLQNQTNYPYYNNLIQRLLQQDLLDVVGIQMHITSDNFPSRQNIENTLQQWSQLGLKIMLSELSIDDPNDLNQARLAYEIISIFANNGSEMIVFWGAGNASWRGANSTLFSENNNPRLSYFSSLQALFSITLNQ